MLYNDWFRATDDLIIHLQIIIPSITNEELKSKYAGFLSANVVTVFELAIKTIFINFSEKKNIIFGTFVEKYFNRINGKIRFKDIREYIELFGNKYLKRFDKKIKEKNKQYFGIYNNDIKAIYSNLIVCRHSFIHENIQTMTFNEVIQSYNVGKDIINILNETMQR